MNATFEVRPSESCEFDVWLVGRKDGWEYHEKLFEVFLVDSNYVILASKTCKPLGVCDCSIDALSAWIKERNITCLAKSA